MAVKQEPDRRLPIATAPKGGSISRLSFPMLTPTKRKPLVLYLLPEAIVYIVMLPELGLYDNMSECYIRWLDGIPTTAFLSSWQQDTY